MSAEVIPLAVRRPIRRARDCYRVEAGLEGLVYLTVVDSDGEPVELVLDAHDLARLQADLADAGDVATENARRG